MKHFISFLLLTLCSFSFAQNTLRTDGRFIKTPCGDTILLRGVNKMHIWTDKTGETMSEIAKSNANSVRIVWAGTGKGRSGGEKGTADQLDQVISNCIKEGMLPIPECHDATGDKWDVIGEVIDYWTRPDIVQVLKKHEAYSILNIANEAGVNVPDSIWFATYKNAITKIRATGLKLPLMIDGDEWGQNTEKFFIFGQQLIDHDPEHNVIFSFHPWWPSSRFGSLDAVVTKFDKALDKSIELNIPLVVGEFARHAPGCALEIPYKDIMEICYWKKFGWLAWSWGPGNGDCHDMDMTMKGTFETFKHDSWAGEVLSSFHGLKKTAVKTDYITHFGECPPYCDKPELPEKLLACDGETINLTSTVKGKNTSYSWTLNGKEMSTAQNFEAKQAGTYTLTTNTNGCIKTASTRIETQLPAINIPKDKDLCDEEVLLIAVSPTFDNVDYSWKKDKKEFSKTSELSTSQAGTYNVTASRKGCSASSNTMTVASPYLIVKDKAIAFAGDVYLKAKGGSGKYAWYTSPTGGTPKWRGKDYTASVDKTTTFYIEDEGDPKCRRTPLTVTLKK